MSENEFILLLSKQLSGDLRPEELAALKQWQSQSPENEQFAADMQAVWAQSAGYEKTFAPTLDADFNKIKAQIQVAQPSPLRVTWMRPLLRAAAAIALLITVVAGWQYFANPSTDLLMVAAGQAEKKQVLLPDGSQVWLRKGATLSFTAHFSGTERLVQLQGEAYFDIQHDAARPFKVNLDQGGQVTVLGTQFGINQTAAQTSVLVRSGKVRFAPASQSDGPVLVAQQKAIFKPTDQQIRVTKVPSLNEFSWQTGGLEFVNTPLEQVVLDLQQFYKVTIVLRNADIALCPHSAPLTSQPIEKVLETLALTHQLKVAKTGERSFELSGVGCQ